MILNSPYISGSLTVTGNTTIQGQLTVTGSLSGTASLASNALLLQGTGSTGFATTASLLQVSSSQQQISSSQQQISSSYIALSGSYNVFSASNSTILTAVSSSQQQISSSYIALSASYNTFSGSASTRVTQIEQVYATTGSNSFRATQSITGSLTVTGQIIAQTINVQQVTSSIIYSSGSNNFGCDLNSRQTFTGSVLITGSLTIAGASSATSYSGTTIYGSTAVCSPVGLFSGCVNIGTAGSEKLNIFGAGSQFINIKNTTSAADMFVGMSSALAAAFIGTGGTDPIVFSTAGTERMRITSTGIACFANTVCVPSLRATGVDITAGTSAVFSFGIDQQSTFAFGGLNGRRVAIIRDSTCADNGLQFGYDVVDKTGVIAGAGTAAGVGIDFYTYNGSAWGNRIRLTKDGLTCFSGAATFSSTVTAGDQIRITGTTANALYLYGAATVKPYITINEFGVRDWKIGAGTSCSGKLSITATLAGTDGITIDGSGNVGVSTTDPKATFHVFGSTATFRVGPWFSSNDRDYVELIANGVNTQIVSPNETFSILNPVGCIDIISCSSGGVRLTPGSTSWAGISDRRKKKNFETTQGLAELLQIEPVKYHFEWDNDCVPKRMGFIAQNILPIIPEMVSKTSEIAEDGSSYLAITPDYILPVIVKAMQEQQCTINTLKTCLGIQ